MQEIWKEIKGYENMYQVSNLGKIKSLKRYIYNNRYGQSLVSEKILKAGKNYGYLHVLLCKNGQMKNFKVHRLVAQAFLRLDITNKKLCVCHKDDNPQNNKLDNLWLGTHKDNTQDMFSKNRQHNRNGEKHPSSKLTEKQVKKIRELLKTPLFQREIAKMYNISNKTISKIHTNKSWKHI